MFRLKTFTLAVIFLIFLIITSIIKNQTRTIEKKLLKISKNIALQEKDINESQLDFYFLTSPVEIEKKIKILGINNYSPIENSKIFLSLSNFADIKKKLSKTKNVNEKKIKKN